MNQDHVYAKRFERYTRVLAGAVATLQRVIEVEFGEKGIAEIRLSRRVWLLLGLELGAQVRMHGVLIRCED